MTSVRLVHTEVVGQAVSVEHHAVTEVSLMSALATCGHTCPTALRCQRATDSEAVYVRGSNKTATSGTAMVTRARTIALDSSLLQTRATPVTSCRCWAYPMSRG
jgi:hypothetical protein